VDQGLKKRRKAIHHIVHDYANFVSSAEMTITGAHNAKGFDPPINTHIGHAFYLNCRKMADFFAGSGKDGQVLPTNGGSGAPHRSRFLSSVVDLATSPA
jgi:hypothetical protein